MIYSGDVDAVVPVTGTMFWINKLQTELCNLLIPIITALLTLSPWRPWYVEGKREVDPN